MEEKVVEQIVEPIAEPVAVTEANIVAKKRILKSR